MEQNSSDISFKDLVTLHQDKVFNTAISFVQNYHDAEDLSQEVFIEVYRSLYKFKGEANVSTWIYRITVNKCIDHLRKKKRTRRFDFFANLFYNEDHDILNESGDFDHPGIRLENKENSKVLFKALEMLPENQKTAFILFNIEELSQKEIAVIIRISPKAVESLIQRAKASLRKKLGKFYDERRK